MNRRGLLASPGGGSAQGQERPASLASAPLRSAAGQPRAQLYLRVLTLPTQDSWATNSRDCYLPRPPRARITHKSFPSSTARLVPISQASEPRLEDEHPPTP